MLNSILLSILFTTQTPPSIVATPYVATSGKTIGIQFKKPDGTIVLPTASITPPIVYKNGIPVGELINPWFTGYHKTALYSLPKDIIIDSKDNVTISAPSGWAKTNAGLTTAMDNVSIANYTNKSIINNPIKTLKPGWNNAHLGSNPYGTYSIPKNWRYRCVGFPALTSDATGKPLTSWLTTMTSIFYSVGPNSGTDQTINVPTGLWAVGWDDTDPVYPTTCNIATYGTIVGITERPEFGNPGINGIGIVKVFDIQQLSTVPLPGSHNGTAEIMLTITNPTRSFHFNNLVIYGPGDFTPNSPTILDRSDPHAISNVYLDRMKEGAGSLRFVDSLWNYGGMSQACEIEQATQLNAFSWATLGATNNITFTVARPWNKTVSPYFYSNTFGDPFPATLVDPIDALTNILNISDATVIVGLRLKVDDELMRVLKVDGVNVTVERGTCSTTPASHNAGIIAIQNRWLPNTITKGSFLELVSDKPHGLESGQALTYDGPWPATTFTNGTVPFGSTLKGSPFPVMVTGPNTVVAVFPSIDTPPITLAQSYILPIGCTARNAWPANFALPVEFAAKVCKQIGADFHINIPNCASDSMVDAIACKVRDGTKPGGKIFVEYTNEPWNSYFIQSTILSRLSWWLDPTVGDSGYYIRRSTEIWKRFQDRFGDRKAEINGLINCLKWDSSNMLAKLEYAHSLGVPASAIAIAPYTGIDSGPATQAAFWTYDDEQVIDLYIHDLLYNTKTYATWLPAENAVIAAYNTKYNEHVTLYAYEGGIQCASPIFNTTITQAIDPTTTTFTVTSAAPMVPGIPLLCESEWMTVVSATGFTITVTRGQYGTTAIAHGIGKSLRTAYPERSHDLIYNPNWYFAEQGFYELLQANGFTRVNSYALSIGAAETNATYGAYHNQTQDHGRGDGSDGKADNRLVLGVPGKPASKSPIVNQDAASVSVRGQAFIDWMKAANADPLQLFKNSISDQLKNLQNNTNIIDQQIKIIQANTGISDPLKALQINTMSISSQLQILQNNVSDINVQLNNLQNNNTTVNTQLNNLETSIININNQIKIIQGSIK